MEAKLPIVGRLHARAFRLAARDFNGDGAKLAKEAADIIEALVEALRPFAQHTDKHGEQITLKWGDSTYTGTLTPEDFYRATDAFRDAVGINPRYRLARAKEG